MEGNQVFGEEPLIYLNYLRSDSAFRRRHVKTKSAFIHGEAHAVDSSACGCCKLQDIQIQVHFGRFACPLYKAQ
jgi:hypothetical protein